MMNNTLQIKPSSCRRARITSIGASIPGGRYSLHSRFKKIINLKNTSAGRSSLIALTTDDRLKSPVNITVCNLDLRGTETVIVEKGSLTIGEKVLPLGNTPVYSGSLFSGPLPEAMSIRYLKTNVRTAIRTVVEYGPALSLAVLLAPQREEEFATGFQKAFLSAVRTGTELLYSETPAEGAGKLRGCGFGLTPSGDDYLSGMLFALDFLEKSLGSEYSALRKTVYENSISGSELCNTFLELAKNGEYHISLKNAALSLLQPDPRRTAEAFLKTMETGETSGADLAAGFLLTIIKFKPDFNPDYKQGAPYAD